MWSSGDEHCSSSSSVTTFGRIILVLLSLDNSNINIFYHNQPLHTQQELRSTTWHIPALESLSKF